jgi:hypothetical protein
VYGLQRLSLIISAVSKNVYVPGVTQLNSFRETIIYFRYLPFGGITHIEAVLVLCNLVLCDFALM